MDLKPVKEKLPENNQVDPEKKDNNQDRPKSMNKLDKFLFVKGNVKFKEIEEGKIQCGGCKEIFSRILGHLTKSIDCTRNIDLNEFKSKWTKFTQRKKDAK